MSLFHLIYVLNVRAIMLCFCCPFFHCLKPCKLIFSVEVNSESTYWGGEIKKSISQIILCSIYLNVKAAILNLAAPGQLSIHKPVTIFPLKKNKNPFASQPLKFSTRLRSLGTFRPRRNVVLAPAGVAGPDSLPGALALQRCCPSHVPWLRSCSPRCPSCRALSLGIGSHSWQQWPAVSCWILQFLAVPSRPRCNGAAGAARQSVPPGPPCPGLAQNSLRVSGVGKALLSGSGNK